MPSPYIESTEDTFDYESDWLESVGNTEEGGANFAEEVQEDTLIGYIPWNKRRSAVRFFKGFAYADDAAPWRLHREQPHQHPDYPQLYAHSVSFKGTVLKGNTNNDNNEPYDLSPFVDDPVTRRAKYTHAVCSVRYRAYGDVWFAQDDEVPNAEDEWFRNTLFLPPEVTQEALTVTGGLSQLIFSETGTGGPTAGTTPFTAPLPELQTKVGFRVLWMNVPTEYISTEEDYFWPGKILDGIGKINSTPLFGNITAGTIRMTTPQFVLFPWWVPAENLDDQLICANVVLNFEWFDPELGATSPYQRGWNNMPWGGNGIVNGNGKYFRATRDGTSAGRGILGEYDMTQIFTHGGS